MSEYTGPERRTSPRRHAEVGLSPTDRRSADRRKNPWTYKSVALGIGKGIAATAMLAGGVQLARRNPMPTAHERSPVAPASPLAFSSPPTPLPSPLASLAPDLKFKAYKISDFLNRYTHRTNADSVAAAVVQESSERNLSPALLVGILLTEDSNIDPHAVSSVGARGLMQVMPMHAGKWGCESSDLFDIATNICHGAAILSQLVQQKPNMRLALQAYNGCVHGTTTPTCYTYSSKVYSHATQAAMAIGEALYIPPPLPIPPKATHRHRAAVAIIHPVRHRHVA